MRIDLLARLNHGHNGHTKHRAGRHLIDGDVSSWLHDRSGVGEILPTGGSEPCRSRRKGNDEHDQPNFCSGPHTVTCVPSCWLRIRLITCGNVSPVFSKTNEFALSDQDNLKLVASAEIQICLTGALGLITKRVSSSSSN